MSRPVELWPVELWSLQQAVFRVDPCHQVWLLDQQQCQLGLRWGGLCMLEYNSEWLKFLLALPWTGQQHAAPFLCGSWLQVT